MSGQSGRDLPFSAEIIVPARTRRELLARLEVLTPAELAEVVVRVGDGRMLGPEALAWARQACDAPLAGNEETPAGSAWRPLLRLTERQMAIVRAVAMGRTNQEIADELGLAFDTVKTHLAAVLKKVGAADRAQLAYRYAQLEEAHRLGLTPRSALQGRSTVPRHVARPSAAERRAADG